MEEAIEVKDDAIVELYGMVQESKTLLMRWKRSSTLSSSEKRRLRIGTDNFLNRSSTQIAQKAIE